MTGTGRVGTITGILLEGRRIWPNKMRLVDISVALTVVTGDVARCARGALKDKYSVDIKKELGNLIVSATRWCDDLGLDPAECVEIALEAQREYQKREKV